MILLGNCEASYKPSRSSDRSMLVVARDTTFTNGLMLPQVVRISTCTHVATDYMVLCYNAKYLCGRCPQNTNCSR